MVVGSRHVARNLSGAAVAWTSTAAADNLEWGYIVSRCPVRETPALGTIARTIGLRERHHPRITTPFFGVGAHARKLARHARRSEVLDPDRGRALVLREDAGRSSLRARQTYQTGNEKPLFPRAKCLFAHFGRVPNGACFTGDALTRRGGCHRTPALQQTPSRAGPSNTPAGDRTAGQRRSARMTRRGPSPRAQRWSRSAPRSSRPGIVAALEHELRSSAG